jgi:hypothetical protein
MFYESYLEEEPELFLENLEEFEYYEDEYRQDRIEEMTNRFGGY